MSRDRPLLGIGLMVGFCALAPLADAQAKLLAGDLPLGQIVLIRFALQTIILWPLARRAGPVLRLAPAALKWLGLRTALFLVGMWLMILSLRYLPLADAIAIAYVMPFILLLMGRFFLNETVGVRRLAACLVGFFGTLLVMQPSFVDVGLFAALPLAVAVIFSAYILVTRRLADSVDPVRMQAVCGLMGTLVLFPLILASDGTGWMDLDPVEPNISEIILLMSVGITGTVSHLFLTWSLRHAPASTLAPVQYLEIPFAVFFGWVIFAQFPNGVALVGIVIVVLAGLYVIWRERLMLSNQTRQSPPPGPHAAG